MPPMRPRRRRQPSLETLPSPAASPPPLAQSYDQLSDASPRLHPQVFSLTERLAESCERDVQLRTNPRRCHSCEDNLDTDEKVHSQLSLPTPLDAETQTKRKKNFMDRCVNKVRSLVIK